MRRLRSWERALGATLATAALTSAAAADAPRPSAAIAPGPAAYSIVLPTMEAGAPVTALQLVPTGATSGALAQSRIIYLNKSGLTVSPASVNDSRTNKSTIVAKSTIIPAWTIDQSTWDATVACVREIFAPFAVRVVTADPENVPHLEAVFGGSSSLLGMPAGIVGVSPFTSGCTIIENSMVYAFTATLPANARVVCEVMAQEIAHSYGLDHELLAADPMTYLSFNGKRAFQDQTAACGETSPRPCGISGSTCRAEQNSVQLLRERLGVADPVAPSSSFEAPLAGEMVGSDFTIAVSATDNIAVSSVEFFIDDVSIGSKDAAPYSLAARSISAGDHAITVEVTDQARNVARNSIAVTVDPQLSQHGLLSGCSAAQRGDPSAPTGPLALALLALALGRRRR